MNITSIGMEGIKIIYKTILNDSKRKERFEMILEPLQSIIQLALISFCPSGSKLSISNNLLLIQTPSWSQSFARSYNQDTRDDLIFLFSVINRFHKFYGELFTQTGELIELYSLLIRLCKKGIDKISQTYSNSLNGALFQTLKMYRIMIDNSSIKYIQNYNHNDNHNDNQNDNHNDNHNDKHNESGNELLDGCDSDECDNKSVKSDQSHKTNKTNKTLQSNLLNEMCESNSPDNDIDKIFIKINDLYEPTHFKIIYNLLLLLENNPQDYDAYIKSINYALKPLNIRIQEWITTKIIF